MPRTSLAVNARENPEAHVFEAVGELDLSSVPILSAALLAGLERGDLILDASEIAFCDSAGLRALLEVHCAAEAAARSFRLAAPSQALMDVLELAGMFTVLDVYTDVPAALKG